MKYRPLLIALVLLCAVGCGSKPTMMIRGTAPAECEGLNVYLVPQPFPKAEEVDSTVVRDGKFEFQVDASQVRICDITISRKSPVPFQRLLVAIEPGELEVEIDEYSNGRGTPLNDDLAAWKRALSEAGTRADEIRREISTLDDPAKIDSLRRLQAQGYADAELITIDIINRNINPLGGFIYMTIERRIDSTIRESLIERGIEKWKPKRELNPKQK
ncbi:MAG: DUF4369 domain-containing protein [Rikenellaceae bacterium]|nr:DUF4369 domain-containing protein [Rikenellaceae bacterium]